jgi:hypothetical protein
MSTSESRQYVLVAMVAPLEASTTVFDVSYDVLSGHELRMSLIGPCSRAFRERQTDPGCLRGPDRAHRDGDLLAFGQMEVLKEFKAATTHSSAHVPRFLMHRVAPLRDDHTALQPYHSGILRQAKDLVLSGNSSVPNSATIRRPGAG